MVEHPEERLRVTAIISFILNMIGGFILACDISREGYHFNMGVFFVVAVAFAFVGYIIAILLCGFGKLIENSDEMLKLMKAEKQANTPTVNYAKIETDRETTEGTGA